MTVGHDVIAMVVKKLLVDDMKIASVRQICLLGVTVEPVLSSHPQGMAKWPLNTGWPPNTGGKKYSSND